jgi:DNA repair protein RadC
MKNSYEAYQVKLSYVNETEISERSVIRSADDAAKLLFESWDKSTIEHIETVKVILLNNGQQLLGIADISQGGLTGSVIDVRLIAQYAITANASAVLLAHNHPSGTLKPSHSDIEITKKVKDAMKLLDITLLDHLIINKDGQYITTYL